VGTKRRIAQACNAKDASASSYVDRSLEPPVRIELLSATLVRRLTRHLAAKTRNGAYRSVTQFVPKLCPLCAHGRLCWAPILGNGGITRDPAPGGLHDDHTAPVINPSAGIDAHTGPDLIQRDQPARRRIRPRQMPRRPTRPAPRIERPQPCRAYQPRPGFQPGSRPGPPGRPGSQPPGPCQWPASRGSPS